jgi:transcriptional regulator with XRE-family HTH domain
MEDHQFGKGLKMLRKSRKLTQQRLAEDSSLSRT